MPGQIWAENTRGGYMYADELSDIMRTALQKLTKFRQLSNVGDATRKGLHAGDKFRWDVYSDIATQGRRLQEQIPIPESNYTISQAELTLFEAGNSIPYTGFLEAMAKQALIDIINKTLRNDARKFHDIEAWQQFNTTLLRMGPTGGTSTTSISLAINGIPPVSNNVALGADHVKAISDEMNERSIPPFEGDDYVAISHPTTWRPLKNDLEAVNQYTTQGIDRIFAGEIGKYENIRFITQNFIPKGGAADSTTYNPYTGAADPWNNGKSSWAFFCGGDTVMEAVGIPEEIRSKIPTDFGRSKAIAWYYLGGYGIVHATDPVQARILKWDSTT